jgi:hypothetical protein
MRKSVKIIIAIFSVMICLLVILSMTLSGTVAKYVTSGGSYSDSARVAKWGVDIKTYSDLVSSYVKDGIIVFQASGGTEDKIIAPGTRGSLICFEVNGTAEVSYAVDIVDESASFSLGDGYMASSKLLVDEDNEEFEYFPIIIKFTKYDKKNKTVVTYGMTGTGADNTRDTVTELVEAVESALKTALDENIAPGEDVHRMYSVEWEWAYSADANNSYQTREKDTILGEALVNNKDRFNIAVSADIVAAQTK